LKLNTNSSISHSVAPNFSPNFTPKSVLTFLSVLYESNISHLPPPVRAYAF
jgi:hypothetical protein